MKENVARYLAKFFLINKIYLWLSAWLFATFNCHASFENHEQLRLAVDNAYRLKVVKSRVYQKEKALNVSKSAYFPEINASLEGSIEKDPSIEQREYYGPGINLSYDLLNFRRKHEFEFSKTDFNVSEQELNFSKQDILFQILSTLYDYFQAKELLEVGIENRNSLKLNYKMVRRKNKAGDLSRVDVERAKSRLVASEAAIIRSEQLVNTFENRYRSITKQNITEIKTYPVVDYIEKKLALENTLTFKRINNQIKLSQKNIEIQAAQKYPTLKLRAFHNEEIGIKESDDSYDSQVILSIELPLYTGGRISAQIDSAKANKMKVENESKALMNELEQEIKIVKQTLETDKKSLNKINEAVEIAKSVVKGRRFEFDNGGGKNNLLLDAEREFLDFKRTSIITKFSVLKNTARLYWRLGSIEDHYLKKKVQ